MRGKRIICAVALLSLLLIVPLALSFGFINMTELPLFGIVTPTASSTTVLMNPSKVVDGSLGIGSTFTVNVDISGVTDLYSWQVLLSWNKTVLSMNEFIEGEFLARSTNQTSSEVLGFVINATDNTVGTSMSAETILGNIEGITEPGTGRLTSIEFLVVGYGKTVLNITVAQTMLLNHDGSKIEPLTKTNGWFNNVPGDTNYSGKVDIDDLSAVGLAYGSVPGKPSWNQGCDFDNSGKVDIDDLSTVGLYYGKTYY